MRGERLVLKAEPGLSKARRARGGARPMSHWRFVLVVASVVASIRSAA
jgi:hypothetical protein